MFKFYNKNVEISFNENFNGNTKDAKSTGYSIDWNNRAKYVNSPGYIAAKLITEPGEHTDRVTKALSLMDTNRTTFQSICDVFKGTKYYTYDHMD